MRDGSNNSLHDLALAQAKEYGRYLTVAEFAKATGQKIPETGLQAGVKYTSREVFRFWLILFRAEAVSWLWSWWRCLRGVRSCKHPLMAISRSNNRFDLWECRQCGKGVTWKEMKINGFDDTTPVGFQLAIRELGKTDKERQAWYEDVHTKT